MNLPRAASVWTIVKGAIAIVVASGLVLACGAPASTPTKSPRPPSPTPTVQPTATSSAAPASPAPAAHAVWTPVHLPAIGGRAPVGGPAGGLDALPQGGFIDFVPVTYERTAVLTSPDGLHWTESGAVTGPYASGIGGAIAWDGHVYVALGSEQGGGYYGAQLNGAAWTSTDLRTWTKAPDQPGLAGAEEWGGLVDGPDGFVAIGYAQGGSTVWTSPDGRHWSGLVDDAVFPPESATPFDIVATSSGFLVVGRIDQQAAAWSSADGHHWTAYGPFPGGTGIVLDGVARRGNGWLSLGIGGPATLVPPSLYEEPAASWISSDGTHWQAGPPSAALFGLYGGVVAAPGGYVAAGTVGAGVGVFVSADGLVWSADLPTGTTGSPGATLVSDGHHVLLSTDGPDGSGLWVTSGVTP